MKTHPFLPRGERFALVSVLLASGAFAQTPRNAHEPRNLVANGSFENPAVEAGLVQSLVSAGAWTAETGTIDLENDAAFTAFEGEQYLALDSWAVIAQTCETRPQQAYALSFAYSPRPKATEVAFEVRYAGTLLDTLVVPSGSPAGWSHRSYAVTGASSQDELELRALTGDATGVWIDDCFLIPYDPLSTEQLLRNGNLEEDPRIDPGVTLENPVFVGWTSVPHKDIPMHDVGNAGGGWDGNNVFHLNDKNTVAQQVYVVPGRTYQLSFAYSPDPADDRDRLFTVSFGGDAVGAVFVQRSTTIAWSVRTYEVTSASPLTSVRFTDTSNGAHGTLLDGITLVGPAPETETAGQVAAHWTLSRPSDGGIVLNPDAMFARGIAPLGDLDQDGVQDLAIGSVGDDDGATNAGAVWIAFMNRDRTYRSSQKISETRGNLGVDLKKDDGFGRALACIGDLDGDGIPELAVGANEDDTGAFNAGAVYVLFLTRQGTVRALHKITALSGDALEYVPGASAQFGSSLAGMGDLDGDGIPDLAVGARYGDSVQVCLLRADGTVRSSKNITYGANGFTERVSSVSDFFGMSCANMGDFDGDGVNDLLVGAFGRRIHGQPFVGGQYLILLTPEGACKRWFYYGTENMNIRTQNLAINYDLGTACAGPGDVDGDGVRDIVTGTQREGALSGLEREETSNQGAIYVLLLNANGTIKTCQRIGDRAGGFTPRIDDGTRWGEALAALGDYDGDGLADIAVGSRFANGTGLVYMLELFGQGHEPLRADFACSPVSGQAPLTVEFTDLSSGPVTGWSWDFGDGTGSAVQDPAHVYGQGGLFTVRLTVSGADGASDAKTLVDVVSVDGGLPQGVTRLGCGLNPPGSFRLLSGTPRIGTTMIFGVDNPLGTQAVGSIPVVVASWTPDPRRPCGTPQMGRSMYGRRVAGERLVLTPLVLNRRGSPWTGPGNPAAVPFAIPRNVSFVGRTMYLQGRLLDATPNAAIPIAFADGFALTFRP